jgi:hypothetical protein
MMLVTACGKAAGCINLGNQRYPYGLVVRLYHRGNAETVCDNHDRSPEVNGFLTGLTVKSVISLPLRIVCSFLLVDCNS